MIDPTGRPRGVQLTPLKRTKRVQNKHKEGEEAMPQVPGKGSAGKRTILVVEDSMTQALHLRTLLEREGLQVACARDGQEGVEKAQELLPDLIETLD